MAGIEIEPVTNEIRSVLVEEDDLGGLTATVTWVGKQPDTAKILEFEYGPQGTWATLLLSDGRILCITQSATMTPACYLVVGEEISIPEEPPVSEAPPPPEVMA